MGGLEISSVGRGSMGLLCSQWSSSHWLRPSRSAPLPRLCWQLFVSSGKIYDSKFPVSLKGFPLSNWFFFLSVCNCVFYTLFAIIDLTHDSRTEWLRLWFQPTFTNTTYTLCIWFSVALKSINQCATLTRVASMTCVPCHHHSLAPSDSKTKFMRMDDEKYGSD